MSLAGVVLANLRRRPLRTLLTVGSILVAFLLFGYLAAIAQAFDMGVDVAGADRLVVRHKVSIIQLLPESYEREIEAIEGVEEAAHATWFGGVYQDPRNFFAQMPVVPDEWIEVYPEYRLSEGEMEAWRTTRIGAVAGAALAERFDWSVGDRVPIQATIWTPKGGGQTWEFELVGIYEGTEPGTDETQFFFRHDYFDENRAFGEGLVGWYVIEVEDPDLATAVAEEIDATFANSPAETKTETEGAFVQAFADQVGNVGAIAVAILAAVFFTILLVAGNTMAQAVRERTRELGVLKALGFTSPQIFGFVVAESLVMAVIGGGLGLAIAWALISRGDPTGGALPVFYFPVPDLVIGVGLVVLLGILAGLLPAVQALRLDPVDAIRRD